LDFGFWILDFRLDEVLQSKIQNPKSERGGGSMSTLLQDLRYAARMLLKSPGFAAVAVLSLALGIGANTTIFSVVNALLFRPLPVKDAHRLVVLATKDHHGEFPHGLSYPDYLDYQGQKEVFSDLMAYMPAPVKLSREGHAERIWIEMVTGNYFSMLGVDAIRGRTFLPEEGQTPRAHPVMVLSYGCWQRRFGSDPSVVGKTVSLNGHPFTVVGIAPERFPGTEALFAADAYVPLMALEQMMPGDEDLLNQRDRHAFRVMGHLQPGVSLDQAGKAVSTLARHLEQEYPKTNKGVALTVIPETKARPEPSTVDLIPRIAVVFMALVGLVLLIACANVANLILARAITRQKEIAIRSALGAGRARLIRQLLTESVLLALLGGTAGLLLSLWTTDLLSAIKLPVDAPLRLDLPMDWRVFAFTLLLAFLTGVVSGLAPAFQASRPNLNEALKEGGRRAGVISGRYPLRSILVVSQVAVSLLLLICSGLFIRSLQSAQKIDLGFRTENLLLVSVDVSLQGYDKKRGKLFYQQMVDRVKTLPGVRSASLARLVPLGYESDAIDVFTEERASTAKEARLAIPYNIVGLDYFKTIGTPFLRGRDFTERDGEESAPGVVIINETMARRLWPGQDPIGKRFKVDRTNHLYEMEVIGVVKDSKYVFLYEEPRPFMYFVMSQMPQNYQAPITLHIHTADKPTSFVAAVREQIRTLDANLPIYDVTTMAAHIRDGKAFLPARLGASLVGAFGLLGLVLAVVGIYGVVCYFVAQRTHEIGIRMALGARPRDVLRLVVGQGMILVLIGVAIGLATCFGVTRVLSSLLYGVSATDPATFAGISLLLAGVALLACYIPARRATKVDPMVALRYE
jgi:predicted permease